MEPILAKFEYLSDATNEIDRLIELANKSSDRAEKKGLLDEARKLIDAYEKHIGRKVFNKI